MAVETNKYLCNFNLLNLLFKIKENIRSSKEEVHLMRKFYMGESPIHQEELIKFYTQHELNTAKHFWEIKHYLDLCNFLRLSSEHYLGENIMRRAELADI